MMSERQLMLMESHEKGRDIDPALKDLFKKWKHEQSCEPYMSALKTFPKSGIRTVVTYETFKESFCPDGFTSINGYYQAETPKIEVLFVLKEAHLVELESKQLKPETDDIFWFNRPQLDRAKVLYRKRIKTILDILKEEQMISPDCNADTPFGYMNINKRGGYARTNYSSLKSYAEYYYNLINEQIDIMQPKLIICCGCYDAFMKAYSKQEKRLPVYKVYHPSARGDYEEKAGKMLKEQLRQK